jgi:N-carbamoyl-L-amino-acid hydrolase
VTGQAAAIDPARLLRRIDQFAAIGATPDGGVDRQALTPGDRAARSMLAGLARERDFAVSQDAMANLFVRRDGVRGDLPPLLIGSHLDSQPTGGRFDGALGVIAAFEVLEALEDAGIKTPRPIELVAWTNEEGSRFAPGAMGSQAFAAAAIPDAWGSLVAPDGPGFAGELQATIDALPGAALRPLGGAIAAYVELHIEQGPVLERAKTPIGVVTGIQGTRWLEVTMTGRAAHAGTTPLSFRRDPLVAAVALMKQLHDTVMPADPDARLTVGRIGALPGSVNAIPGSVSFSLDLRHPLADRLADLEARVRHLAAEAAATEGCSAEVARTLDMPPADFPETLRQAIETAAARTGHRSMRMLSGAFHDALYLAHVAPAAMVFVPCRDGLSHNPGEFVHPQDAVAGTQVMLQLVLDLCEGGLPIA